MTTMREVLYERASHTPEAVAVSFLEVHKSSERLVSLTYSALDQRARAIAARLRMHLQPGDRAALLHTPGLAFVEAFFGCVYAGVIAVPLAPPHAAHTRARTTIVVRDAGTRLLLWTQAQDRPAAALGGALPTLATDVISDAEADTFHAKPLDDGAVAFLQYTSGSMGDPKGVIVPHRTLLENLAQIGAAFRLDSACVGVNWLPLYHDMGLIGTVLEPIYRGFPTILMSPHTFVQRPERWLRAITRMGGTVCGGPNFAYQHCVERMHDEMQAGLDLRSWRVAFCGAEPIHPATMRRFIEAFGPCGFRATSFYPCYGLAEATLFVTGGKVDTAPVVQRFDAAAIEHGQARLADSDDANVREIMACGFPYDGTEVVLVNAQGEPVPPGYVGEIWVRGRSVAAGYWGHVKAPCDTFAATLRHDSDTQFLRTGDLGVFHEGQLFVTGRMKALLIIEGRNIAPQDLEWTAQESHPSVRCAVAFGVEVDGAERAVMLVEVSGSEGREDLEDIGDAVRRAIGAGHDVVLEALIVVKAASLPKTTSGKLARIAARCAYLEGHIVPLLVWQASTGWRRASHAVGNSPQEDAP